MQPPLSLTEELVLLSLDHVKGSHLPLLPEGLAFGLAGAALSDLEMAGRIETAGGSIRLRSAVPPGDPVLDPVLSSIALEPASHPIAYWLSVLSDRKEEIEQGALESLIARGILRREEKKILWVFGVRRYPTVHDEERVEVRTRLVRLIAGEEIPTRFDATLISLLTACGLLSSIFTLEEISGRAGRIAAIADSDPVGREVASVLRELVEAIVLAQSTSAPTPF